MNQKTNKIIVISAISLTVLIVIILLTNPSLVLKLQKFQKEDIVKQCENLLKIPNKEGKLPPQRICRLINETTIEEIDPNSLVKPQDKLIIAVDLPKIIKGSLRNVFTGKLISKPTDETYVLCYVIYPMLKQEDMYEYKEEVFDDFYSKYFWKIHPFNLNNLNLKGNNFICTKPLKLSFITPVLLEYQIPKKEYLVKAKTYSRNYGFKILLVPDNLKYSLKNSTEVAQNAHLFDPIFYLMKPISFK